MSDKPPSSSSLLSSETLKMCHRESSTSSTNTPLASCKRSRNNSTQIEPKSGSMCEKEVMMKQMILLLEHFSEEQHNRYEVYRRAKFSKSQVKRVVKEITGVQVSETVAIAMAGVAKVFVGQIIEAALDYKEQLSETGPLRPKHIREALRRIRHHT